MLHFSPHHHCRGSSSQLNLCSKALRSEEIYRSLAIDSLTMSFPVKKHSFIVLITTWRLLKMPLCPLKKIICTQGVGCLSLFSSGEKEGSKIYSSVFLFHVQLCAYHYSCTIKMHSQTADRFFQRKSCAKVQVLKALAGLALKLFPRTQTQWTRKPDTD